MKSAMRAWAATAGCLVMLLSAATAHASQHRTQTFDLHPGWNSIYLEVVPTPADTAAVFQTIPAPVLSVWTWNRKANPVQFIQDPADGLSNSADTGWLGWFPGNPATDPQAALTNLFRVQPNRPYLVHLGGTTNVTWTVSGRPSARDTEWVADSFNLTGLPVEDTLAPTFAQYFAASPEHTGQPIYRLNGAGTWDPIPAGAQIKRGEAYWIYCAGGSTYTGPLQLLLEEGDSLEYGQTIVEATLRVRNLSATPVTVRVKLHSDAAGRVPMTYRAYGNSGEVSWPDLPAVLGVPAEPGQEVAVLLGMRRADLTTDQADGVIEVTDGRGTRRLIPVHASRAGAPASFAPVSAPSANAKLGRSTTLASAAAAPLPPFAGLWLGTVRVNAVSQSQIVNTSTCPPSPATCFPQVGSDQTTPVKREFAFRVLVHVDEAGQARLLKEVIQMWKDGVAGTAGGPDTPGHFALVTDDAQIPNFEGAFVRDGRSVGRRLSTAAYDFAGTALSLSGTVSPSGTLTTTFDVPKTFATNPFTHGFHPDHDNTINGLPTPFESYDILRRMEFRFTAADPTGKNPPEWGSSILGGTYREEFGVEYTPPDPVTGLKQLVKGIHKNPIAVEGTFELHRVSLIAQLNQ